MHKVIARRIVLGIALVTVSVLNLVQWRASDPDRPVDIDIGAAAVVRRANAGVASFATSVPTVRVVVTGCGGVSYGSGVIITGGRVLTARHVVEGAESIRVENELGRALSI